MWHSDSKVQRQVKNQWTVPRERERKRERELFHDFFYSFSLYNAKRLTINAFLEVTVVSLTRRARTDF